MISRYSLPEMERIWSLESKVTRWLDVEQSVAEVQARRGIIPPEVPMRLKELRRELDIRDFLSEIEEKEKEVQHDVVAFLMVLEEKMGREGRFIHFGLTSSDVLDTALALSLKESLGLILRENETVRKTLEELAERFKGLRIMARTHGVHAEPSTLGLRFLGHAAEFRRNSKRLEAGLCEISYGKISGAVGTFAFFPPEVEQEALMRLGLKAEPVSTQIVPRDRHAQVLFALSLVAAAVERLSLNLRLLHQTEVAEVKEAFKEGQRGSSAMPHKKNPILSERLCGLSRLLKGYLLSSPENIPLWFERDISHSSVERFIFPDAMGVTFYMLRVAGNILSGLKVEEEKIRENLELSGDFIYSQALLLALIERGAPRYEAYRWVQEVALGERGSMKEAVMRHEKIGKFLKEEEIERVFSHDHLGSVGEIFKRYSSGNSDH